MPSRLAPTPTVLDEQALARLRELDPGGANHLVQRVVDAFLKSLDQHAPVLAQGCNDLTDLGALRHVAHTLKSAAASLGATTLSQRCAEIEAQARDGRRDGLPALLDAVLADIEGVRIAMRPLLQPTR
ncbi:Hpt domain-containing protein [Roseateles amylovorans]|uniref:Hpt domain-containing protein n=1 Tax=Roseateles amylovorans TaxID=2978473 RepID=A0ABY6B365_9BURK|nr:Hpt domain-containing protein [Roseateles amylovorans]UXH79833.1 Hpt domain-containing protein [Roseateles amylovorans]